MNPVKIAPAKIVLRDWMFDDLEVYAYWLQPQHNWQQLDGPYFKKTSVDEIPELIVRVRARIETANFANPRHNLVIADAQHNRMIGLVSRYWISEETHWLAAGIVIYDSLLWGKGYGRAALGLWTNYLFHQLSSIVRLDLQTWSGNLGMNRLALKLRYRLEGQFRKARIVDGEYYDAMGYGILRDEWCQLHPDGFAP